MRAAILALPLALLGAATAQAATFTVDSTGTATDAAPGNGVCRTAGGACTLRAAVAETEALGGQNAITVPAGTYALAATLELGQNRLRITGAGAGATTIDGDGRPPVIVRRGTAVLAGLRVTGGDGTNAGGGVRVATGAILVATGIAIDGNEAFTGGGGLYVAPGARARVLRTSITGNAATGAFGGGVWNQGELDLEDSLVAGNRSNRAGGLRNEGELRLRNVTVSGNEATSPEAGVGGISQNGFAFLSNVTVVGNLGRGNNPASFRGGGIQTTAGELTVLKNSLVSDNDGRGGPADCDGPITSDSRYNLMRTPSPSCGLPASTTTWIIGTDPQLGALADNGGPTRTHLPAATSPVVDAGFPFAPGGPAADACEREDARGILRLRCDIGAVEREVPVPATIAVTSPLDRADAVPGNGTCAAAGGACTLRAAVQEANRLPGRQRISVPAGVYILAIAPAGEGGASPDAAGDLDILEDVQIIGAGAATTRVDGNALSRILETAPGADLELEGIELGNGRDGSGGALRVVSGEAVLRQVVLRGNVATSGGGGAIAMEGLDERLELIASTLADNRAEGFGGSGGAIRGSGAVIVRDSTLSGNRAAGSGGAIDVTVGTLELTGSTVRDNEATGGVVGNGGGVSASAGSVTASTISGNRSAAHGGGIYLSTGTVENATISGNTAGTSGGGLSTSGAVTLQHVTLARNGATVGGVDLLRFGSTSSLRLVNTIVGSTGGTACSGLPPTSGGGNVARDATCALAGPRDRVGVAPRLGSLALNGGPTATHLLLAGSPALDNGVAVAQPTDQRGAARPLGVRQDTGAVEGGASFATGSAPRALVVGADGQADGAEARVAATLRGLGLDARPVADADAGSADLGAVRLVVIARSADAARIAARVTAPGRRIVTWDGAVARRLRLVSRVPGTATARALRVTPVGRSLLGISGRVVLDGGCPLPLLRLTPSARARILARIDIAGRPAGIVASRSGARRVVLPLAPEDATTTRGRRLVEAAMRWAARP